MKYLDLLYLQAKSRISNFLNEEKGEVNIVATVVLIGIAVGLAVIFKDAIQNLIEKMLAAITNKALNTV